MPRKIPLKHINVPMDGSELSTYDQTVLDTMECYQIPDYKVREDALQGKDIYYVSRHGLQVPDQIVLKDGVYSTCRPAAPTSWTEQSDPNLAVVALRLMRWDDKPWPPEKVYVRRKKDELDREVGR